MDDEEILRRRLRSQGLTGPGLPPTAAGTADVVRRLGAVQAQDHEPALWSLAQRAGGVPITEPAAAFEAGAFVRTHVLRPTWHFVPREDLRWLIALTGPRVAAACAPRWRELGLPAELRAEATAVLVAAIAERGPQTRAELKEVLEKAGVDAGGQRMPHLLIHAELECVLCSGGMRGRQQTWVLVDDRVPPPEPFDRDGALRRLAVAYIRSHGPATVRDFGWWSGLPLRDVRRALDLAVAAGPDVEAVDVGERRYWYGALLPDVEADAPGVLLLQNYDEYLVGYSESRHLADPHGHVVRMPRASLLSTPVVVDGRVAGHWRRATVRDRIDVEVTTFTPLAPPVADALEAEAARLGAFLGRSWRLEVRAA